MLIRFCIVIRIAKYIINFVYGCTGISLYPSNTNTNTNTGKYSSGLLLHILIEEVMYTCICMFTKLGNSGLHCTTPCITIDKSMTCCSPQAEQQQQENPFGFYTLFETLRNRNFRFPESGIYHGTGHI